MVRTTMSSPPISVRRIDPRGGERYTLNSFWQWLGHGLHASWPPPTDALISMDFLRDILAKKSARLAEAKRIRAVEELGTQAAEARKQALPHRLLRALRDDKRVNVIAEFKRRSPSKGLIRVDADAVGIARQYERGGAVAISVLTEQDYFAGSLEDLAAVRTTVELPILRKDFIIEEYQVYESAAAGADALLLIVAALEDATLAHLRQLTEHELGMDALVEIHTRDELKRALAAGAKLIGINNRDLRTFEVSLDTSIELACEAPADVVLISESGFNAGDDLRRLSSYGYKGFLIGETLMRANEPETLLRELMG
jgi:indole-3-glycerol phosphate synthase